MNGKRSVILAVLMLITLIIGAGSTAAQNSLRDMAAQEGFGWLAGRWTATTDQGDISLSYRWELDGHMASVDFRMRDYSYRGMIFYVPEEERAIEVGVDNKGGRAKGVWEKGDKLVSRTERTDAEGNTTKMAIVHSKVDVRTMKIALHAVDENGAVSEEPWATMEFKRKARKAVGRKQKSATGLLEGTWKGKEIGGRGGSWTFVISGNEVDVKGPEPESYSGTLRLKAKTKPRQVDFVVTKCAAPQYIGQASLGIYKIQGKKLTLVACEPGSSTRPTDFEGGGDARMFVLTKQ